MSKPNIFENKAFQQTTTIGGFNLVPQTNSFNSVFNIKSLDLQEASRIEQLLKDNFHPDKVVEEQIKKDVEQLKQITSEIKAIGKQGTILMGERVHRAKELLKPYKDGTFTKWLESTFGTRKTGYNMLAYYDLYTALPHDNLREHFKKIPQRAAYILASREGNIDTKVEIINESHNRSHLELINLIQEKLPVTINDKRKRKSSNSKLIAIIREAIQKIQLHKNLTSEDKVELFELIKILSSLANV